MATLTLRLSTAFGLVLGTCAAPCLAAPPAAGPLISGPALSSPPGANLGTGPGPVSVRPRATTVTTVTQTATGPLPSRPPTARPHRRERMTHTMRVIRAANVAALSAPASNSFLNAALVYDYEPGRLYRIDASPRFLTTIMLRPGEHLISKAAGDTVRWTVGETSQGAGDNAQAEVVLKPVRGGQSTNLVLTTDQRTYFLQAVSHDEPIFTSVISWNYPLDQLREAQAAAARAKAVSEAAARTAPLVESNLAVDHLNFDYRIDHPKARHAPDWEPARVFDDGAKTYLQFPPTLASSAAPPLFLIGPGGQAELVNYRVKGSYYIVDRLIDVAELRLGQKPQIIVRITRTGARG